MSKRIAYVGAALLCKTRAEIGYITAGGRDSDPEYPFAYFERQRKITPQSIRH